MSKEFIEAGRRIAMPQDQIFEGGLRTVLQIEHLILDCALLVWQTTLRG